MAGMKPFLRIAVFCETMTTDAQGRASLVLIDTTSIDYEGGSVVQLNRELPTLIRIEGVSFTRPHRVRLRWVDEEDRYLDDDWDVNDYPVPAYVDPEGRGLELAKVVPLRLTPPRPGDFRLLIELDGQVIGWIPFKLLLTRTTRGES